MRRYIIIIICILASAACLAQKDSIGIQTLKDVVVSASKGNHSRFRTENTDIIGQGQLIRAACCNLGESFTTNPSVDVSYSDAATGAKQIKLLGLSGTYVQMLTENIPNLRGACIPYSLGFIPGPWMQAIQVSKGASSVKNGYESTTGQINIEYHKPQTANVLRANAYLDTELKQEYNLDGNIHLNDFLSTSLLLHFEDRQHAMDDNNDGFMDMPKLRQYNIMNRWAYVCPSWISQLSMRYLYDERNSGQMSTMNDNVNNSSLLTSNSSLLTPNSSLYTVRVKTNRFESQWKNAYILQDGHNSSIALMLHCSYHDADNTFGVRQYDVAQTNAYAQLMFETDINENNNLSVGASYNYDHYNENMYISSILNSLTLGKSNEAVGGLYAQYTYKLGDKLTVMPGLRWDCSTRYHGFITPRLHVKYSPWEILTIRASAGKGYRTPHPLAENVPLLASGRTIIIDDNLKQEEAWNYGISAGLNIPIGEKNLEINAEYYYTHFINQMVINVNSMGVSLPSIIFENLNGKSYSHTFQVDATYPLFEGFTATAAFRYNDVRTTYDGKLRHKPLTSLYKSLLTLSYKTPMELWHFDVTGSLNGKGYLYPSAGSENIPTYPTYFQLQAQMTREFRHFSIYLGGENLTNYKIKNPITNASNPWSSTFDATQIWGPTTGAMAYIGIRFKLEKI